ITRLELLPDTVRGALERGGVRVVEIPAEDAGQPARALPAARVEVEKARAALERRVAERRLEALAPGEWLLNDGRIADMAALSGLIRLEARADADTVATASALSAWLLRERAPLATPDRRWDRLLYPIHDVETYLRARAPRDFVPYPASRLPRTGS